MSRGDVEEGGPATNPTRWPVRRCAWCQQGCDDLPAGVTLHAACITESRGNLRDLQRRYGLDVAPSPAVAEIREAKRQLAAERKRRRENMARCRANKKAKAKQAAAEAGLIAAMREAGITDAATLRKTMPMLATFIGG